MKLNYKQVIVLFFLILLIFMLSVKTTYRICTLCGIQDYERSLFGIKLEFISEREVDELGTYKKWQNLHEKSHEHQWVEVDEFGERLYPSNDSLPQSSK
jgi:hypothetical protein